MEKEEEIKLGEELANRLRRALSSWMEEHIISLGMDSESYRIVFFGASLFIAHLIEGLRRIDDEIPWTEFLNKMIEAGGGIIVEDEGSESST